MFFWSGVLNDISQKKGTPKNIITHENYTKVEHWTSIFYVGVPRLIFSSKVNNSDIDYNVSQTLHV